MILLQQHEQCCSVINMQFTALTPADQFSMRTWLWPWPSAMAAACCTIASSLFTGRCTPTRHAQPAADALPPAPKESPCASSSACAASTPNSDSSPPNWCRQRPKTSIVAAKGRPISSLGSKPYRALGAPAATTSIGSITVALSYSCSSMQSRVPLDIMPCCTTRWQLCVFCCGYCCTLGRTCVDVQDGALVVDAKQQPALVLLVRSTSLGHLVARHVQRQPAAVKPRSRLIGFCSVSQKQCSSRCWVALAVPVLHGALKHCSICGLFLPHLHDMRHLARHSILPCFHL